MPLFSKVGTSIPALMVALGGVGLAWIWLKHDFAIAILAVIGGLGVGLACFGLGHSALKRATPRPKRAVRLFEFSILAPGSIAAIASAALIFLAIDAEDIKDPQDKALVVAAVAAVTGLLTTAFIKDAEEADESWIADLTKSQFQSAFEGKFKPGTASELAVFSKVNPQGWDRDTRRERAKTISDNWPNDNAT